jgi:hypothetical protein
LKGARIRALKITLAAGQSVTGMVEINHRDVQAKSNQREYGAR